MTGASPEARERRRRLSLWVAREVIPHEATIRGWLRQRGCSAEDADDLVQDAYAKLAGVSAPDQITRPAAYFFQIVRHLFIDLVRRARVVRIEAAGDGDDLPGHRDDLDPEKIVSSRDELSRVLRLVDALPQRCRDIIKMKKIEGLSQREIAQRMGVSESIVENDIAKGLALVIQTLRREEAISQTRRGAGS